MALYYKKVDAIQFTLTEDQKELIKQRKPVLFEGTPVKHIGGNQHIVVLQQGENLIRICESQWLVRHPDGLWQLFWPDKFGQLFKKGDATDNVRMGNDPFITKPKSYNQPNTLI